MPRLYRMEPRIFGVATAIVTHNTDPEARGRIRVRYPWLREENESGWARLAVPYAGDRRGFYLLPEVGDEVLVAFEEGDPGRPVIVGSLWSGRDALPCRQADKNPLKWFESRSGLKVICDDSEGAERILIRDAEDRRSIEIDMAGGKIRIAAAEGDVEIAAPRGRVDIRCETFGLACSKKAEATIETDLSIRAKGSLSAEGKQALQAETQGRMIQSGRTFEARGAASAILRGNRVEVRGDALLRQKAPLVQIN